MATTLRYLILLFVVCIISFSPLVVGVFPIIPGAVIPIFITLFSAYAFRSTKTRAKQVAMTLLSISLTLTLCELISRPIMAVIRDDRPKEISPHSMARLPQVYRYLKNVNYEGTYYGDLAIMARKKEWREPRNLRFVTDGYGFRNNPTKSEDRSQPLGLIMLGDSFGEGLGTTQDSTWASLLERDYGFKTYNLSMDGAGPWQEFVNLSMEIDRLNTNQQTIVLWAFFTGNDLGDEYLPQLEKNQLPWLSALGSFRHSLKVFRDNSQLRQIVTLPFATRPPEQVFGKPFIDGSVLPFYRVHIISSGMPFEDLLGDAHYPMLKATMGAMRKLAETRGFKVLVVSIPCKEEVYSWALDGATPWIASKEPSGFARALKLLSDNEHFQFTDLKPALIDAAPLEFQQSRQLLYWRDDTHWNVTGNKVAATIVSEKLLSMRKGQ